MNIAQLQRVIVDALEDVKAQDIRVFDTEALTAEFERFVVATATSNRQTRSLAASVRDKVREGGGDIVSVEGLETGEWVLVDCGDAVVNIMQPAIREYYKLEELWGSRPVAVKLAGADKRARSAREPSAEQAAPSNKPTVRKAATRDSIARIGAKSAPAKKATAKSPPARKKSSP